MSEPTYRTTAGFKTLPELLASIEACAEVVHYAKAVEDAAAEVVTASEKLQRPGMDHQIVCFGSRTSAMDVSVPSMSVQGEIQ